MIKWWQNDRNFEGLICWRVPARIDDEHPICTLYIIENACCDLHETHRSESTYVNGRCNVDFTEGAVTGNRMAIYTRTVCSAPSSMFQEMDLWVILLLSCFQLTNRNNPSHINAKFIQTDIELQHSESTFLPLLPPNTRTERKMKQNLKDTNTILLDIGTVSPTGSNKAQGENWKLIGSN